MDVVRTSGRAALALACILLAACGEREQITTIAQLDGKQFAVPTATAADQLVTAKLPNAKFLYVNPGLVVLAEKITTDDCGFAFRLDESTLKAAADSVAAGMRASGEYQQMVDRWLPAWTSAP